MSLRKKSRQLKGRRRLRRLRSMRLLMQETQLVKFGYDVSYLRGSQNLEARGS